MGAAEGNLSIRLEGGNILCTPSGVSKGHMAPDQLVVITDSGEPIGSGLPSSEIGLHLAIYKERPDCKAVIHAHPPVATSFALANRPIPDNLLPESAIVLGSVINVPFALPGTPAVGETIRPLLQNGKTFLLANHGAVVLGKSLLDAFFRMETLERVANVVMMSEGIGKPQPVPANDFAILSQQWLHGRLG